jgi:hypothetical protein
MATRANARITAVLAAADTVRDLATNASSWLADRDEFGTIEQVGLFTSPANVALPRHANGRIASSRSQTAYDLAA